VIDRYDECFVIQALDQGMDRATPAVLDAVVEMFAPRGVVLRNDVAVRKRESLPLESKVAYGEIPDRVEIRMNGLKMEADLLHGQKTGVYLDQRENYVAAAKYARGMALDCFTSTGGFALHLSKVCESVTAIDSSEGAVASAQRNAQLNGIGNVTFETADVFDYLSAQAGGGPRFETVVLDPPAFAKSRSAVEDAARGYKEINLRALRLLKAGGVLVTCSCSHHMSEAMLLEVLASAALDAGRTLRVLERRTQAADHPILLTVPETLYLKCLILEAVAL
jgi:23S rRNA (cytosine1962-C5)-methyltransferase